MAGAFRLSFGDSPSFVPHLRVFVAELEAGPSGSESLGMLGEFLRLVADSTSVLNVVRLSRGVVVTEEVSPESLRTLSCNLGGIGTGSSGTC